MISLETHRNAFSASVYPFQNSTDNFDLSLVRKLDISIPKEYKKGLPIAIYTQLLLHGRLTITVLATQHINLSLSAVPLVLGSFTYTGNKTILLLSVVGVHGMLVLNHTPVSMPLFKPLKLLLMPLCVTVIPKVGIVNFVRINKLTRWIPGYTDTSYYATYTKAPASIYNVVDNVLKIRTKGLITSLIHNHDVQIKRQAGTSARLNRIDVSADPCVNSISGVTCNKLLLKTTDTSGVTLDIDATDPKTITVRVTGGSNFPGCR